MKYLFPIIGLLLLMGCSAKADGVTSWGTHYVVDPLKVTYVTTEEYRCIQTVKNHKYEYDYAGYIGDDGSMSRDRLRSEVQKCDWKAYEQVRIKEDPPTYYFYTGQQNGANPYEEFDLCVHGLASTSWDFPEGYPVEKFRASIQQCLDLFPAKR